MWEIRQNNRGTVHVLPVNDIMPHIPENCPCNPNIEDGCIVHNSFDKREALEPIPNVTQYTEIRLRKLTKNEIRKAKYTNLAQKLHEKYSKDLRKRPLRPLM